jgi:hypothetical protein
MNAYASILIHYFNRLRYSRHLATHYTTVVAEDGKSWFSDGFFLGKGMILCSEKHVPPSVKNYVRLSR